MRPKNISRGLYWIPRVIAILFILFLAMFSLDVFDSCAGFLGCALALFMHNLPALVLLSLLVIGWRREWIPASIFFIFGIWYIAQFVLTSMINTGFEWYYISWIMIIALPAFIIGALFWLNWKNRKKSDIKKRKKRR